jgi:hypothetical protein
MSTVGHDFLLSVVIPTLGREELNETLEQLSTLPMHSEDFEVIIGGNGPDSHSHMDFVLKVFSSKFKNLKVRKFESFLQTAEENTLRSVRLASGKHVWVLGDDDLLLREGLNSLARYAKQDYPGVFFNYKQMTSDSVLLPNPPFFSTGQNMQITFADLVSRLGIQSIPTGFGRFLIRRDLIDFDTWDLIIKSTGELFSHVLAFATFTQKDKIIWEQTPIIVYRQSSYHEGSDSTWRKYGELKSQPWITPFCGQLAGQIRFLVENGIWTVHQAEFSLLNERENTIYQADYLLQQIGKQLREAIRNRKENLRVKDLDSLGWFFLNIAPTRLPVFRKFYNLSRLIETEKWNAADALLKLEEIEDSFPLNSADGLFAGGIEFWVNGFPVFGLPYGLVQVKEMVSNRNLVMRIFDLDMVGEGHNFKFFKSRSDLTLEKINYDDIYLNSLRFESRSSWSLNSKLIEYYSIPRVYSNPSLYFMRLSRRAPRSVRKFLKRLFAN